MKGLFWRWTPARLNTAQIAGTLLRVRVLLVHVFTTRFYSSASISSAEHHVPYAGVHVCGVQFLTSHVPGGAWPLCVQWQQAPLAPDGGQSAQPPQRFFGRCLALHQVPYAGVHVFLDQFWISHAEAGPGALCVQWQHIALCPSRGQSAHGQSSWSTSITSATYSRVS